MSESIVKKIIEESGNNLHCKVIDFLRKKDWQVLISPYYIDNITGKSREIDIIAEKEYEVKRAFGVVEGFLNVRFFIECKYANKETVFWFDKKDVEESIKVAMKETGLKHPDENVAIKSHRYLKDEKVAKLFASSSEKNIDNEPFYRALNQVLTATSYYRNHYPAIRKANETGRKILKTMNYLIVLVDSFEKIFKVGIENNNSYLAADDNFLLEVNYAYLDENKKNKEEYCLIDIVDFTKFDKFLENIDNNEMKNFTKYWA